MSSATDMKRVMARIKKMLKLADNNPSAEEAAVAASMASKLMDKYNLEHADVLMQELDEDSIVAHDTGVAYARDVPPWVQRIIVSTAQLHDCEAKYTTSERPGKRSTYYSVTFLGEKSDVIVASWVFDYLLAEMKRLGLKFSADIGGASNVQKYSFRKACAGEIASTLRRMLKDKEDALRGKTTGKDLIIMKRDLVRKKFNVSYGKGARRQHYGDGAAAAAGAQAGRGVSIRQGIEKSANRGQRRLA